MINSPSIIDTNAGRTRKYVFILLCIAAGSMQFAFAQSLANYKAPNGSIVRSTGITYNSIEFTGNAVPSWRFTGSGAEDDDRSFPVSIGFDFWYLGTRYTTFSVSTNGFIDFSSATNNGGPATNQYGSSDNDLSAPASATTRTMPLTIAPFYYDQTTDTSAGGLDALGNGIRYLTTGSAGSRVLTVEWIRSQPWYSGAGGNPSFNYQVKLYEGTGEIEFVYGYMDISTFSFAAQTVNIVQGYTSGMNGTSISTTPTAAEMLVQQSPNSTTFSEAGVNGGASNTPHTLQTLPASYTSIKFSPPVPTAPTGISFTSVTQTSMQVNWSDSPNEIAYTVYRSDDGGATYNFITQLAAGTLNYNQTGLLAGTTYYWKVYSVSEGGLSSALTGNQATSAAGNDTTAATGLWSSTSTWKSGIVPTAASNVVIADGHTVTVDQNVTVNSLSVGLGTSGTLQIGNDATARTFTVVGNIDVRSGGTFRVNTASNTSSHVLNVTGNIQNSGTFDMSSDADSRATTNFTKSGTQSISGSGSVTRFYLITMNLGGSISNVLDVFATNFSSSAANYLTLTSGTFNLATGVTTTPFTGNVSIPLTGGLRVNHASAVLNTTGGNITVAGELRVLNGTVNIGNASDNNLISNGGVFVLSGGALNVAGRFEPLNSYVLTNLSISSGTMTLNTTGSTSTTSAPFNMNVAGSIFTMSGGTIVIQNPGNPGGQNLGFVNTSYTNYNITGGTIQIGNGSTPAASTIRVNSSIPVYDLVVNSANVSAQLVTNNLTVLNNVTVTAGTLNANGLNMSVAGNWSNSGTFTPSTGKVTFNGTGSQSITDASGETFNKLFITNSVGSVTMVNNVTVSDSFALSAGTFAVGSLTLTLNGVVTGGGTLTSSSTGTVNYNKSSAVQNILAADYGNLTFSNFVKTLPNGGTVGISGTFNSGTAQGHTVTGSTVDFKSSGAQNIPLLTYHNLTLSNAGTKTLQSGADTVLGTLTIGAGNTLADGGVALNVFGAVSNSGVHSGAGSVVFRGSSSQSLTGGGTFQNLTLNNAAGVVMSGNATVNGTLTFTSGVLSTGTDTVTVGTSGSVSRTSGHVYGWLEKNVAVGSNVSRTFEVGGATASIYTPATFVFTTVSSAGNIAVTSVAGEHPDINSSYIDATDNVNRSWQSVNSGGLAYTIASGYSLTLTFINPGDLDQTTNTASFRMNVHNGVTWDSTTAGTRTATTTQATGVDSLGTYVVGIQVTSGAYRTKATGNWNNFGTVWERFNGTTWVAAVASPTSANGQITIQNGHTVTVTANVTIDQTIVESGGTLIVNGGNLTLGTTANSLLVNGTFRWVANTVSGATITTLRYGAGGLYQHALTNAAQTAIPSATWNPSATCEVTGATLAANNAFRTSLGAQAFGNFKWNSTGQSALSTFSGTLDSVMGNFMVTSTGSSSLVLYGNQTTTMTVGGSFVVNGGTLIVKNNTGNAVINVGRNDSVTAGSFTLTSSTGAVYMRTTGGLYVSGGTLNFSTGAVTDSITIRGDLSLSGGTFQSSAGTGILALQGNTDQIFTGGSTVSGTVNVVVFNGATIKMGTNVLGGNAFTLSAGSTIKIGSTAGIASAGASGNVQSTTRTFSSAANYVYEGAAGQITGVFTTTPTANTVYDLTINNSSGVTLSSNIAVDDTLNLTTGNLAVSTFTLTLNNAAVLTSGTLTSAATGTVNYNKSSAGQSVLPMNYGNLTFSGFNKVFPSGTVGIAGTFNKAYATGHTITGSTVDFNGASQSIPKFTFNNLIVSGSGTKSVDSNITVNGNLTLSAGTLDLMTSSVIVSTKGNVVNNAATSGSGKITLTGGSSAHLVSGSGTFNNLELNDALGATASTNVTVNGTLTMTNGAFGMGSNTMTIGSSGSTVQTLGYVNGKLEKTISVNTLPQSYTFEVGDATTYAPVSLTFNAVSVAGTLTVNTTGGNHPLIKYSGLDQDKMVNRYWTLTNSGITFTTYDITLNFVAGDLDAGANTNAFFAKRYNSTWFAATTVLRNSTWIKNLNLTGFGDFATGEVSSVLYWTKGAGTYNWGDDNNWSTNSQPTAFNDVVFDGKDTINVNVSGVVKDLVLQNDTLRLTIQSGNSLTVSGNLTQYSGDFRTKASFPSVSGTVTLSGGVFGYDTAGGPQTISAQTYKNLRLSGSGGEVKTAASSFTVNGNLSIGSGTVLADGGADITVKDSLTVNGAHTGSGKIILNGTTQHQLTGAGSVTNLQLNNSSNGVTLDSNVTVNGVLTLTSGVITAPNDTLYISSTGSVSRTSGHVFGNLRRYFTPASDSLTFNIGTATQHLPATVSFGTISSGGNLTVQMIAGEHPDISASSVRSDSSVNRYWIVRNSGIAFDSYNITFNWLSGDVDAGISDFSDFIMAKKDNGVWDEITAGTVTSTSMRGMNGTSFSEFAVGKPTSQIYTSVMTGNWSTAGTWDLNKVPKRRDQVVIASPHVVTLVDARKISRLTINSGGELADGGNTLELYGSMIFNGKWSGSGRISWEDNVTDTLSGSSGKATGTSTLFVNGTGKLITAVNDTLYRVQIASGNTVTNNGTVRLTRLIGDAAGSTWVNAANASLNVGDSLLAVGTLTSTANNNTVIYNGTGAQTVKAGTYHHLTVSGARTVNNIVFPASTISIAGTFTPSATFTTGVYSTSGNTIDYTGAGAQTIAAFDYHNLTVSGARGSATVTLAGSDTIAIAGTLSLTATSVTYSTTNSLVEFNGTGAQSIPAFNYHSLRFSGTRTTNSITLAGAGTIGVAGSFTNTASFTSGDFIVTGSTVQFNGSGAQSIPSFTFNNLETATGGTKTASGNLRILGNVTIGASTTFDASSSTDTLYGNWTNSGTFTPSTSTIALAGSGTTVVTGATTFATLVVNKSSQSVAVNLSNSINAATLTMTSGTMNTSANSVTVTSTRTGNGIILGTITRTHTFALSTPYAFEGPNSLITFTSGTPPTSVTMTSAQTAPASPTFVAVNRAVNIALTGGSGLTSTLRLHYENADANSLNETLMKLWQYSGSWINRNATSYDSVSNYLEVTGLTNSIAGDWAFGTNVSTKSVSDINGGTAVAGDSLLYTISVTNPYNVTKSSIVVTDPLDNNLILKSGTISNSGGIAGQSNNGNGSMVGGTITWPSFSLASGATAVRTFKTNTDSLMDVSEAVNNTAAIDFGGGNSENVSASVTITNVANIGIDTNVVSNTNPIPGDTLVYTLKYRNAGTSNATMVTATYTIPANTTFVINGYGAAQGIQVNGVSKTNASDGDEVTVSGSTITITFATLTPGSYKQVKFKTIVN